MQSEDKVRVPVADPAKIRRFEQVVLPHLDSAYNLAYWLTRSHADAQDVVQEASFRAFKYFDSFAGGNAAAWLLSIVRRACFTWLKQNRPEEETLGLEEDHEDLGHEYTPLLTSGHSLGRDPEALLIEQRDKKKLHELIAALPAGYREVIVLRELEELSYRDIADVAGIPIGTVMSRLARARGMLQSLWRRREHRE
jgi:RNA polymerase sigma-70 factor, ECF subfamily